MAAATGAKVESQLPSLILFSEYCLSPPVEFICNGQEIWRALETATKKVRSPTTTTTYEQYEHTS